MLHNGDAAIDMGPMKRNAQSIWLRPADEQVNVMAPVNLFFFSSFCVMKHDDHLVSIQLVFR